MVDRMDIDALLIGSLYGELTPADEARLHAHLESHPADRTVLSDLTRARQAVRESRIFELQLEPPQAVSALLLQEAARRAPRVAKPAPERDEPSWFQRFVRAFVAHPALAAACTVVVVIGVATMLYVRNGAQFAEPEVEPRSMPVSPPANAAAETAPAQQVAQPPPTVEGAKDEFKVGLGDQQADPHSGAATTEPAPEPAAKNARPADTKPTPTATAKSEDKTERAKKRDYIEVDRPSPTPKELGEGYKAKLAMEKEAQRRLAEERVDTRKGKAAAPPADPAPQPAAGRTSSSAPGPSSGATTGAGGGAAGNSASGSASPGLSAGSATTPAPGTANNRGDNNNTKDVRRQPATPAPQAPAASPPPPPPPSDATVARDRAAEKPDTKADKPAEDITWARAEHDRVIASVKANKCMDAANRALAIESRTPAYYAQNVANDRAIKSCVSYITAERSRRIDAEKKASRAKATERRADEPAKPATNK
jgi:hypothetical protein